jgi:hypothetical protein
MTMVVKVKKKLSPACFNLLYLKLKRGTANYTNQKDVIPPANNNARCKLGMVSK